MLVRVVYDLSDRRGLFFAILYTHHVGFPLRPFTDLLCIHGYHPTLYTAEPPLSGHLLSGHPPLSGQ